MLNTKLGMVWLSLPSSPLCFSTPSAEAELPAAPFGGLKKIWILPEKLDELFADFCGKLWLAELGGRAWRSLFLRESRPADSCSGRAPAHPEVFVMRSS